MAELFFYIEPDVESGYVANCASESIITQGDTIDELKQNISDAIHCHFDSLDIPDKVILKFIQTETLELV